jgi:hypothetical protein
MDRGSTPFGDYQRSLGRTAASPELVFSPDPGSIWQKLVQQAKLREIEWNFGVVPGATGFSASATALPASVGAWRQTASE